MRDAGRHPNDLAARNPDLDAADCQIETAVNHLDQRIEWGRVLGETLSLIEGEERDVSAARFCQDSTDDRAGSNLDEAAQDAGTVAGERFGLWVGVIVHVILFREIVTQRSRTVSLGGAIASLIEVKSPAVFSDRRQRQSTATGFSVNDQR